MIKSTKNYKCEIAVVYLTILFSVPCNFLTFNIASFHCSSSCSSLNSNVMSSERTSLTTLFLCISTSHLLLSQTLSQKSNHLVYWFTIYFPLINLNSVQEETLPICTIVSSTFSRMPDTVNEGINEWMDGWACKYIHMSHQVQYNNIYENREKIN